MKVYTKTGDQGESGLFGGGRVAKDHSRLQAYGTIDELNAFVGELRALSLDDDISDVLETVQHQLFAIGAELASPDADRLQGRSAPVSDDDVAAFEVTIDAWEKELSPLKNFILPGGCESAARAHVLRTVVRRAEREVVRLSREATLSPQIIKYLNRLSDLVFVMARVLNKRAGVIDIEWTKEKARDAKES